MIFRVRTPDIDHFYLLKKQNNSAHQYSRVKSTTINILADDLRV
jgi:hypothetical protein